MSLPFGFGMGESPKFDLSSLGAALQQLGAAMQSGAASGGGPVLWDLVRDTARKAIAAEGDPSVAEAQRRAVADAVRLADLWLDQATIFPVADGESKAWSRSEWLEGTLPAWQRIVDPIAAQLQRGVAGLSPQSELSSEQLLAAMPEQMRGMFPDGIPNEMLAMIGPMMGMVQQLGAVAFSTQLGQSLGALAREVVGGGDIGIPLAERHDRVLLPGNLDELAEGLGLPPDEVRLYFAVREAAYQRLFAHVPWLAPRVVGAIEEYARGLRVDSSRLGEAMEQIDMSDPSALQQLMSTGVMEPEDTPEQKAALARLQTLLALVEGWVDAVAEAAVAGKLSAAPQLRETVRRRRASGGAAERAFGTLVGLELRPASMREAATVFAAMTSLAGIEARDALWGHPDLLPTTEDLQDPMGFVQSARGEPPSDE